jgi:hypothetical protein
MHGTVELVLLLISFGGNVHLKSHIVTPLDFTPLDFTPLDFTPLDYLTPLDLCDLNECAGMSRQVVLDAFNTHESKWLRIKNFIIFRSSIYGSAAFQKRQEKLLLPWTSIVVKFGIDKGQLVWDRADKVFGNFHLCRYIVDFM